MKIQPVITVPAYITRDAVTEFLATTVTVVPGARTSLRELHAAHVAWSRQRGHTPLGIVAFGKHLAVPRQKSNGTVYLLGIQSPQA